MNIAAIMMHFQTAHIYSTKEFTNMLHSKMPFFRNRWSIPNARHLLRRQLLTTSRTDALEAHPERAWQIFPSR
jgi:hypothetical protein